MVNSAPLLSARERIAALDEEVAEWVRHGWRVESRSDFQAVLAIGKPVSHLLHAILAVLTAGLWLIGWLIVTATGGEDRELVSVDSYGNIDSEKVKAD